MNVRLYASTRLHDGTFVYARGGAIRAISTLKRREFDIPLFDTIIVSQGDYEELTKDEPYEVPFQ